MRLFQNTLARAAPLVLSYGFSFVLAPLLIARIGLAPFGVWAVTGAVAQYARLLDLGISGTLGRFVAYYDAKGDERAVRECVGLGLLGITIVVVLAAAASVPGAAALSDSLGVLSVGQMRTVLFASVAIMAFDAFESVLLAVPVGMRRMVAPGVAGALGNVVNFGASVGVLAVSTRLTDYALANAAAEAIALALGVVVFLRATHAPRLAMPTVARAREVLGFSVKSQLVTVAQLVNQQTDKVIIALLVSAKAAGVYEVAGRVATAIRALGIMTLSAMIPTATAALVEQGRSLVRDFYRRYTLRTLALAYPLYGAACVSAPYLFSAWLGRPPHQAALVLVVLTLAYVPTMATGVAMTLVTSDGRPGVVARTAAIVSAINILATVALAPVFGLWGVLAGTAFAEVVGSSLFLARFHRLYELPVRDLLDAVAPPIALAAGLAVPFAIWYAIALPAPTGRWTALPGAVSTGSGYLIAYWVLASRAELLPERLSLDALRRRRVRLSPKATG